MSTIILWSKPSCVQCKAVERWLKTAGVPFEKLDLTAEEHEGQLLEFKARGFLSAPITEYAGRAVPGFNPDAIDELIDTWRADSPLKEYA